MRDYICRACAVAYRHAGRAGRLFCPPCAMSHLQEAWRASHKVHRAVASGLLPPAVGQQCRDCSKPAKFYDHRDYTKPLEVEAVCVRCNCRRGTAFDSNYRPAALPA